MASATQKEELTYVRLSVLDRSHTTQTNQHAKNTHRQGSRTAVNRHSGVQSGARDRGGRGKGGGGTEGEGRWWRWGMVEGRRSVHNTRRDYRCLPSTPSSSIQLWFRPMSQSQRASRRQLQRSTDISKDIMPLYKTKNKTKQKTENISLILNTAVRKIMFIYILQRPERQSWKAHDSK